MHTTYFAEDDILADKPITREVSQNWNTHVSYAEDGSAVKVVLLEARANGAQSEVSGHADDVHFATLRSSINSR